LQKLIKKTEGILWVKNVVSILKHNNKRISKLHKPRGYAHLSQCFEFSPITL
jgi:hypothetical protein